VDVLPFPAYRDNMLLAGDSIDDFELCTDMIYGVNLEVKGDGHGNVGWRKTCREGPAGIRMRTGLIVWDDPWLQRSWEVDEVFARKYRVLFKGCEELIQSTNFWRAKRGEPSLVLDD